MSLLHLNAFTQASPCHQFKGMWKHPDDRTAIGYRTLDYWLDLARLLERGRFDALFFADVHGLYDVYGGDERAGLRHAVQVPGLDPTLIISALAAATEHLGFAVTYSTTYHAPYLTAKVFSTLDHLTRGRIAWNVVTSYLESAVACGLGDFLPHDVRYDRADEYLRVCYRLWEESWDDDAVVLDRERDVFTDPDPVHRIDHEGDWFKVRGPHQVEPSPQRTPLIYQAGASERGTEFAATHAEVLFIAQPSPESCRVYVDKVKGRAAELGRDPDSIKLLQGARFLVGESEADVARRQQELLDHASPEGTLALWSGWTGIDVGSIDPSTPLSSIESEGVRSIANAFTRGDAGTATVGDVAAAIAESANRCNFVGTAEQVADQLEMWAEAGVDGFNVITTPHPTGFETIVDLLVPELQRRGRFRKDYEESTLRERFFGPGRVRLPPDHPARSR